MNIPPIGFIGTGNMGSALARAVRRALPEAELFCSNRGPEKARALAQELGGRAVSGEEAAWQSGLLFLGVKPNGIPGLLESLARVKALYRKPFRMLMIGDGPDKKSLEERSRMLGLQADIVFTGTIPNERIAAYFKAADGFLFASKTETQGIVVLEAFAGATPVIAVRASGVEDLVDDGANGFLTGEDTEEYAGKVADFLEEALDGRMARNAFQKAALYREEAVAFDAVHYYNSVIAESAMHKKRHIRLLLEG